MNMNKQQYLAKRLKRDFIRYALLKKPEYSDKEITDKLKGALDTDKIYREVKDSIDGVIDKYLSLERLKDGNGGFVSTLPEWLKPSLAGDIVNEYRKTAEHYFDKNQYMPVILQEIEKLVWAQGIDDMAVNLKSFIGYVTSAASLYNDAPEARHDDREIQSLYEAAKHVSLRERITGDNDNDILRFRSALADYTHDLCEKEMYSLLSGLYLDTAHDPGLNALVLKFGDMSRLASADLDSLEDDADESQWADEYLSMIPIDFFRRNIADISEATAFHMAMLMLFSRHEKYLIVREYLTACGELRIFTRPDAVGPYLSDDDFTELIG